MAESKGPAKGASTIPRKTFTPEETKANAAKGGYVRAKLAAFARAHPELADKPEVLSRKARRHVLEAGAADALQRMRDEINDPKSAKGAEMAKSWMEFTDGKPKQAVELSGEDGGPLKIEAIRRVIIDPKGTA